MTAFLKLLEIEGSQSLPWIAFLIVGLSAVLGILKLTQKITKTAVSPENTFLWISLKRIMERLSRYFFKVNTKAPKNPTVGNVISPLLFLIIFFILGSYFLLWFIWAGVLAMIADALPPFNRLGLLLFAFGMFVFAKVYLRFSSKHWVLLKKLERIISS